MTLPAIWGLAMPWRLRPAPTGSNKATWYVETSGETFILRLYSSIDKEQVDFEQRLLLRLQETVLSFAVPAPLRTVHGETLFTMPDGSGAIASLCLLIPGSNAIAGNLAHTYAAGRALAELHGALADISRDSARPNALRSLDRMHPLVPSAVAAPDMLPLKASEREAFRAIIRKAKSSMDWIYRLLPSQLIHSDYSGENVLLVENRVTGILDFEFATFDVRALDVALGLFQFSRSCWGTGDEWPLMEALAQGYTRQVSLTEPEIEAMPDLLRVTRVGGVLYFIGRMLAGLDTVENQIQRVNNLINFENWVDQNGDRLMAMLKVWSQR